MTSIRDIGSVSGSRGKCHGVSGQDSGSSCPTFEESEEFDKTVSFWFLEMNLIDKGVKEAISSTKKKTLT